MSPTTPLSPSPDAADAAALPPDAAESPLTERAAEPPDASLLPSDADPAAAAPAGAGAPPRDLSPTACARELKTRFPALFGDAPKPIKLRIQADIQQRAPGVFSKKALSIFLHRHTGSTSYLMALSRAKSRFDLDGQPAGELSDEHRQLAAEELKRRRALHEERRAQEEAQWLNRAHLLRDFDSTTLTRANFCALKGVAEDELDGLLDIARREKAEWEARRPPMPERRDGRPARPGGGRPQGPAGERGARPAGAAPRRERPGGR